MYKEEVVNLTVATGDTRNDIDFTPVNGKIVGCVIFTPSGDKAFPSIINAGIKEQTGDYASKMQDIRNYRSREAAYPHGFKPLNLQGGMPLNFTVQGNGEFNDEFTCQLILIYEQELQC